MFFVCFLFCHSWVVMDFVKTSAARLHFPSNLNHDKKLVSETALAGTSFFKINVSVGH